MRKDRKHEESNARVLQQPNMTIENLQDPEEQRGKEYIYWVR